MCVAVGSASGPPRSRHKRIPAAPAIVHQGARVTRVQQGSPAALAGLSAGDIIVALQGDSIRNPAELATRLSNLEVGSNIRLDLVNGSSRRQVSLAIGEMKPEPVEFEVPANVPRLAGIVLATIEPGSALFGDVQGIQVTQVKRLSRAALSGLIKGDIIVKIDNAQVRTPQDIVSLAKGKTGRLGVEVLREGVPVRLRVR